MSRPTGVAAPTATGHGRDLVAVVRRFRARARIVVFIEELWTAIAIGAAAIVVWTLAWATPVQQRRTALAVILVGAVVVAVVRAYRRAPSLGTTGQAIDRSRYLQDRVVAALGVVGEPDAMSALIIRDACTYLDRATPADVFPVTLGRRAIAGTILAIIAALTVTVEFPRAISSRRPIVDGTMAGPAAASGPAGGERPIDAAALGSSSDARAVVSGSVRPPASSPEGSPRSPDPGGTNDRTRSPSDTSAPSSATSDSTVQTDPGDRSPIERPGTPSSSEVQAGGSGQGQNADPGAGAAGAAPDAAAPGARLAGAGGSVSPAGRRNSGESGGVAAGEPEANPRSSISASSADRPGRSLRDAGTARGPADVAVSTDDIPPARRQYVRDYFLRLRSPGGPR